MKRLLFSALTVLFAGTLSARQLTSDEALSNALTKLNSGAAQSNSYRSLTIPQRSIKLSHTECLDDAAPLFYVYDMPEGGFLMAGADSRSAGLLGYTDSGSFDEIKQNPAFQGWLADCTAALQWLSKQPDLDFSSTTETASANAYRTSTKSVAPLLGNIKWGQNAPYNSQCPERLVGDTTKHCPTGCVATAAAQILMYHQWPDVGTGTHTNQNDSTQTVDFSQSHYDWANMAPTYTSSATGDSVDAVAKLMSDIGCAVDMIYDIDYGESSDIFLCPALTEYFKYDKSIKFASRAFYSTAEWNTILTTELDNLRPVLMSGTTAKSDGHAFVVDGYDTNGLYHINWGWQGECNGYYDINYLKPDGYGAVYPSGFQCQQSFVYNIRKDEGGTAEAQLLSGGFMYNPSTKKFSLRIYNLGLGSSEGSYLFRVRNNKNKVVYTRRYQHSIPFNKYSTCSFALPADLTLEEGFTLHAYYQGGSSEDEIEIPARTGGLQYIECFQSGGQLTWGRSTPQLTPKEVTVKNHWVGFAPSFSISISNDSLSKEYHERIIARIYYGDMTMCSGMAQLFVQPGEEQTIELLCLHAYDGRDYSTLTTGEYTYTLYYYEGINIKPLCSGTISMENPAPSNITYSDFALDKSVLCREDKVTASFKAQNTGGFDQNNYYFYVYPEGVREHSEVFFIFLQDIQPEATTVIQIPGIIHLDPGNYVGVFYSIDRHGTPTKISGTETIHFTVTDASTNIKTIDEADDTRTESRKSRLIYHNGQLHIVTPGGTYGISGTKLSSH